MKLVLQTSFIVKQNKITSQPQQTPQAAARRRSRFKESGGRLGASARLEPIC
jgi:hypothetical protein